MGNRPLPLPRLLPHLPEVQPELPPPGISLAKFQCVCPRSLPDVGVCTWSPLLAAGWPLPGWEAAPLLNWINCSGSFHTSPSPKLSLPHGRLGPGVLNTLWPEPSVPQPVGSHSLGFFCFCHQKTEAWEESSADAFAAGDTSAALPLLSWA